MNSRMPIFFLLATLLSGWLLLFLPVEVYAQGTALKTLKESFEAVTKIGSTSGVDDQRTVGSFIAAIIRIVTSLVAIIAVGVLIIGGFMYITSAGDETKASRAKTLMLYAIIGLLIIGIAGIAVNAIINSVIQGK